MNRPLIIISFLIFSLVNLYSQESSRDLQCKKIDSLATIIEVCKKCINTRHDSTLIGKIENQSITSIIEKSFETIRKFELVLQKRNDALGIKLIDLYLLSNSLLKVTIHYYDDISWKSYYYENNELFSTIYSGNLRVSREDDGSEFLEIIKKIK